MTAVRDRYEGFQDVCKALGESGCHFLTLCSIAEEHLKEPIDFVGLVQVCRSKKWITKDFFVDNDGTPILEYLTGLKWTRKEVVNLPVINDNDYTEAIYYNPRTKFHHYRRRYFDVKENSVTVAEGHIEKYYIYTVGAA